MITQSVRSYPSTYRSISERKRVRFLCVIPILVLYLCFATHIYAFTKGHQLRLGPVILKDVTDLYGLFRISPTFGAAALDANQDRWPDLVISNHGNQPILFLNIDGNFFQDSTLLPLKSEDRHAPVPADYDNDGDPDLYFLHGAHQGTGLGPNEFLINPGSGRSFVLVKNRLIADPKGRGRGAVWFDYDMDGFLDLLVVNDLRSDAPNKLFLNEGKRKFKDVSVHSGLNIAMNSAGGAVAGDIDNDGDMDLMFASKDRPYLFINKGDGTFIDETALHGLPLIDSVVALGMADFNNDGFLDVYISRGYDIATDGALLSKHRINFTQIVNAPDDRVDQLSFYTDTNAVLLFQLPSNPADLRHQTYIGARGVNPTNELFVVGPGNLSADGRPPQWKDDGSIKGLFIWVDHETGLWTIATGAGADSYFSGGLITSDSALKKLVTTGMEPFLQPFPGLLLVNNGNGTFRDATAESGTLDSSNGRSPLWVDLDNDGDLDLFVVNAGYNGVGKQRNILFLNRNGVFSKYEVPMDHEERFGRGDGGLIADFNRDGKSDLFIVNGFGLIPGNRGPYQLFLNQTQNQNHWIDFRLIGGGMGYSNRDAIGAKINVKTSRGKSYWRFVLGGSGSSCQPDRMIHFGLGDSKNITAKIYWLASKKYPKGHQQSFSFRDQDLDQSYTIDEIKGLTFP